MYYIVYPLLWLLSLLPFWLIYGISDFFHLILYRIIGYRKNVVMHNLGIAFPEKTEIERKKIATKFYSNMIDTFLESIKFITITERTLTKRSTANFEVLHNLIAKGKSIHIMAGHQFNWEYANLLFSLNLNAPCVGIYMPISNKILDRIFFKFRAKTGTILISATDFKSKMHAIFNQQYVLALAADQNPGHPANAHWMPFFDKPTPFVTGPAKGAIRNNAASVLVGFQKIKRGYYHFNIEVIAEETAHLAPKVLTKMYKDKLEQIIKNDPTNYLWSHRRFKYDYKPEYGEIVN